jgi:hypothetical protein
MRHDDRSTRVLRALTRAWAAALARENDAAVLALFPAMEELETDLTFARCHVDVLTLLEDVTQALQADGHERRIAVPASGRLMERATALQARLWGPKA